MSRPLLGGSAAAAVALFSASLLFYAQPSVAVTLAETSQKSQTQQPTDAQGEEVKTPAVDASAAQTPEANGDIDKTNAAAGKSAVLGEDAQLKVPTLTFTATAYSLRGRTASGRNVARGIIAADRRVLPIGTRVRIDAGAYSGEYLVADTGGAVRGRKIDIWVPSTGEAVRFGRRGVKLTVLSRPRTRAAAPRPAR